MRFISSFIGTLITIMAICFAVTNRQTVSINLWPMGLVIETPVWLLTLGCLITGITFGALATWFGLLPQRLALRRMQRDLMDMNKRLDQLQQSVNSALPPVMPALANVKPWRKFWSKN